MKANSRRNSTRKRTILVVVIVLGALALGWVVPAATSAVASVLVRPVVIVQNWLAEGQSALPVYLRGRQALEAELETLRTQANLSLARDTELAVVRAENDRLRGGLAITSTSTFITAGVLAQPPLVPYDRLVLRAGTNNGVTVGAPVYVGDSIAIGTIIKATQRQSVVELISSPGAESTVYVFGPDIYTTAVGEGGGIVRIGVPQGIPIAVGDPVLLPAGSQSIVGTISQVEAVATRPEQYAFVTLPVPLQGIHQVQVASLPLSPQTFDAARETVETTRETLFTVPVPEGVLVDIPDGSTSTATSTATSTDAVAEEV
jgi:cell shape-determining protein MreC